MLNIHHLYPEVVYRFNAMFFSVWKGHELGKVSARSKQKDVYVVPVFFSKSTRTFHWIGANSPMWKWEKKVCQNNLTELIDRLSHWTAGGRCVDERDMTFDESTRFDAWKSFLKDLRETKDLPDTQPDESVIQNAIQTVEREFNRIREIGPKHWVPEAGDWEKLHRAVLAMYSGFHQNAEGNIEGIYYKLFRDGKVSSTDGYLTGTLSRDDGMEVAPFDWLHVDGEPEACRHPLRVDKLHDAVAIDRTRVALEHIALNIFLEHILLHEQHFEAKHQFGLELAKRREVALLPLHDFWFYDKAKKHHRGYGSIKALFIVFFTARVRDRWLKARTKYPELRKAFNEFSDEVTNSAQVLAASQPIQPPYDLVQHFLRVLRYVQDWESAAIFKNGEFQYRYKRIQPQDGSFKWGWEECSEKVAMPQLHESITKERGINETWGMWWTAGGWMADGKKSVNLWSRDFIPSLEAEDVGRFGNLSIYFEFPAATRIPTTKDRSALRQAYLRQQFDLMRVLIPKVRARRAALRSAVSAIMGRNMSHNIGSHVLARYSGVIQKDLDKAGKDHVDHRGEFLSYLQRRMDFLAEVATSDHAFWEQPLSMIDVLRKLNYKEQKDLIVPDTKCPLPHRECRDRSWKATEAGNKPILLRYIAGKESIRASVVVGKPGAMSLQAEEAVLNPDGHDEIYFSCPGGEVGIHALYVILENVIRNSARHAPDRLSSQDVALHVVSDPEGNECIKLTIIDSRTVLDEGGWVLDTEGNRTGKGSLVDRINHILNKKPFLNNNGSTNPEYWGMREMQICAHYLRGLSLSDLEGHIENPAVFKAKTWLLSANKYCLSYELYLKRAKLLAYVEVSGASAKKSSGETKENEKTKPANRDKQLLNRGIKPIRVTRGTEAEWKRVASESRGYSFLALPHKLMNEAGKLVVKLTDDLVVTNCDRVVPAFEERDPATFPLPVRVIRLAPEEITEQVNYATKPGDLDWMRPLHEAMTNIYRNNGDEKDNQKKKRWGKGKICVVMSWLAKEGEPPLPSTGQGTTTLMCYHRWKGGDNYAPFQSLPDEMLHIQEPYPHVGIAWLDHPEDNSLVSESVANLRSASLKTNLNFPVNWASVEPLWSHSQHFTAAWKSREAARQVPPTAAPLNELHEIAAAAFARVVVLDERIQSRRHDTVRAVTLYKYWPQAGIWCPLHPEDKRRVADGDAYHDLNNSACNLDKPEFEKIRDYLVAPTKLVYQLPADFLVLHLTILERLNNELISRRQEDNLNATLDALVKGTSCEKAQKIIVTGRGVPAGQARINARHLPISALQEYLVMRPSKLGFMRVLWAAAAHQKASNPGELL